MRTMCKELLLLSQVLLTLSSCDKNNNPVVQPEPEPVPSYSIYPVPSAATASRASGYNGWVGDVMPHFADGKFQLFFLHDATDREKQTSAGQHPIHRFTTENLTEYTYEGEVISYGNSSTQDHLVGTGSMVEANGTYYFYYTGHNGSSSWLQNNNAGWVNGNNREAVMYATSTDLLTWTKQPAFNLKAPEGYNRNEFRDPYVFYNEEFSTYWMLVSAQRSGRGELLVYTSADPAQNNWQLHGPLHVEGDYLMLECADIFKLGNQYYMLFAEDWSNTPGTHYRVASSTNGPWVKPSGGHDMFDGHQFYAARMASNGTKYYSFGWAHRRNPESDNGTRTWGGNLISHELTQLPNNRLGVRLPESIANYFSKAADLAVQSQEGTVSSSGSNYMMDGSHAGAAYQFGEINGSLRVSGTASFSNTSGTAAIGFNVGDDNNATYNIRFEPGANRIAAYNNGSEVTRVPFSFEVGKAYSMHLVVENSVVILYLNDEVALTNRIYGAPGKNWKFSANGMKVDFQNAKVYTH